MMKTLLASTVALALSAGTACLATDATPSDQSAVLTAIDTDHDGTVTLAEAKVAATAKFDHLDTDKEGTLDAHELTGLLGPKMAAAADTDHDKTLDHAEYLDVVAKAFARADADHDGTLDPAELSTPAGRELVAMLAY